MKPGVLQTCTREHCSPSRLTWNLKAPSFWSRSPGAKKPFCAVWNVERGLETRVYAHWAKIIFRERFLRSSAKMQLHFFTWHPLNILIPLLWKAQNPGLRSDKNVIIWTLLFNTDTRNIFLVSFIANLPKGKFRVKIDACEKQHLLDYAIQPTLALLTLPQNGQQPNPLQKQITDVSLK